MAAGRSLLAKPPRAHSSINRSGQYAGQAVFEPRRGDRRHANGLHIARRKPAGMQAKRAPLLRRLVIVARQRRTRLVTRILSVPRRLDAFFAASVLRRVMWTVSSFGAGFYAANTVSLSFGAIAVNDVVAAVFTVAFCEIVSKLYYGTLVPDLKLVFLNSFKMGVIAALMADAMKLGG